MNFIRVPIRFYAIMSSMNKNLLRFDYPAAEIVDKAKSLIENSKSFLDSIATMPADQRSFSSVVAAMTKFDGRHASEESNLTFPSYVSSSKETRDACTEARRLLSAYAVEAGMRLDVFQAVKSVFDNMQASGEYAGLSETDRRLVDRFMRDYRRNGLDKPDDIRERIKEVKKELNELSINFGRELAEDQTSFEVSRADLAGMPEEFIANLKKNGDDKFVLTLDYPVMFPILKNCKVEETRKKMEFTYGNRCAEKNIPSMQSIIQLRQELASLLGYDSYSDYALEVRMAKTVPNVMSFLQNLHAKLVPLAEEEKRTLLDLEERTRGQKEMNAWDFNYLMEQFKEKNFSINENELSQYFPTDHVIKGMFDIYQRVLNVRVEKEDTAGSGKTWHEDVELYSVYDKETGEFCGQLYLDLYPRPGKYGHAAAFSLQPSYEVDATTRQYPISALVCNFTKATETQPSLLRHSEVTTFLHEAGHGWHGILSRVKYPLFSGTRVELDFVEVPSQAFENWTWHKEGLRLLSKHYKTGESLPDDMMERLIRSRSACSGLFYCRQLFFGFFDMHVHTVKSQQAAKDIDIVELWAKMRHEISRVMHTPGTRPAATFNHLASSYGSGYYSYIYSLLLACDLFSKFEEGGDVFSSRVGLHLRDTLLSKGGSKDGDELIRDFLGRDPSNVAFLKELGISE
ncbi:mitochondrial neurolysin [Andalucia godoyi]|uniref:Mitochondrial neurolysin n=1 Tax=Andalucia godoyi TaxID=505711 RepID=A0A8K0AI22_ANDGO|nr:mitochondrial neurolysin [Andalucia godoyi]|eukprot:ANDGO_06015.mRNA.1 mitochondrial neurolysin